MNRNSHKLTTTKHNNTQSVRMIRNEHNFTATKDQFCDQPTIYWSFACAFTEEFWSHSFACTIYYLIIINCADASEGIELPKCVSGTFCRVCLRFFPRNNAFYTIQMTNVNSHIFFGHIACHICKRYEYFCLSEKCESSQFLHFEMSSSYALPLSESNL